MNKYRPRIDAITQELVEIEAKINGLKSERIDLIKGTDTLEISIFNYVKAYGPISPNRIVSIFDLRHRENNIRNIIKKLIMANEISYNNTWELYVEN